jgi:hypothetical protein
MKKTLLSISLGLILAAAVLPALVYARGCYATLMAVDPETGEQVNCSLISDGNPCRYHCPGGDIEW